MLAMSAAFRSAIASGYQIETSVQVLSGGNPVPGAVAALQDATVTVSRTASARRSVSFTLALTGATWPQLIPSASNSGPVTPFGNEIAASFGWRNPAAGVELVQVGVYAIETVTVNDTGTNMTLSVTGYDRAWTMSLRKFTAPYAVAAGTRGDSAMSALVTHVLGSGVPQNITPAVDGSNNPLNLPGALTFNENTDPWSAVGTIATAIGYEAFFDARGTFVARPLPDPTAAPVAWSMVEGLGNIAKSYSRSLTRNSVSNDFIVTGSGSGVTPPVRGQVQDTDPASPMRVSGPFGDVPTFTNSSLVATAAQAQLAAANQLAAARGQIETLTVTTFPCPAFEPDDVVYCKRARAGIDGWYVIDTVSFSMRHAGATTLTMRRVK